MDQEPLHPPEVATVSENGRLQTHIQSRIAAGTLPRIDGHAWAGISQGLHRCACCHEFIPAAAPLYAPRERPDLFAHLACFDLWHASELTASTTQQRPGAAGWCPLSRSPSDSYIASP